ncbi:MAG: hypothetical protein BGP13_14310 [Sphingobacteriales bacterium 40-81]|nr:MAG: hypothetical protein BGP13_14310 [Sphingobacteriales bacterium 40-81]
MAVQEIKKAIEGATPSFFNHEKRSKNALCRKVTGGCLLFVFKSFASVIPKVRLFASGRSKPFGINTEATLRLSHSAKRSALIYSACGFGLARKKPVGHSIIF